MNRKNYYDVTEWNMGNPYEDIGEVINSIIVDIKSRQTETNIREGGKPGAVIYIPSGDYHLRTQVVIDISYLKIMGAGHGFVSSSIRYNLPESEWKDLHEIWPGGSRILVDLSPGSLVMKQQEPLSMLNEVETLESVRWNLKISVLTDCIL